MQICTIMSSLLTEMQCCYVANFLPSLASNHHLSDLHLSSSLDSRHKLLHLASLLSFMFFMGLEFELRSLCLLVRQVLYRLSHTSSPFCSGYYYCGDGVL
jgi:hypothetical protein